MVPRAVGRYIQPVVEAIGVPFDLCGKRMGSRLGPAALKLAGLEESFDELRVEFGWGGDLAGCSEDLGQTREFKEFDPLLHCISQLKQRTDASLKSGST